MSADRNFADSPLMSSQPEVVAFTRALPQLLADHHQGQFVVLKNSSVEHVLPTYEQALSWGYERFGLDEEFFVKQVQDTPQVTHFRRFR